MTIEELLHVKPVTFGVSSLNLKDGTGLVQSLMNDGVKLELGKRLSIAALTTTLQSLPVEQRDRILGWEIDLDSQVEAVPLDYTHAELIPDSKVINVVNQATILTLCITTLILSGAVGWNIVFNHEYPKVSLAAVILIPITLCALWVIGVLRGRQSLMSVVLGDNAVQETVTQSIIKGVANNIANRK